MNPLTGLISGALPSGGGPCCSFFLPRALSNGWDGRLALLQVAEKLIAVRTQCIDSSKGEYMIGDLWETLVGLEFTLTYANVNWVEVPKLKEVNSEIPRTLDPAFIKLSLYGEVFSTDVRLRIDQTPMLMNTEILELKLSLPNGNKVGRITPATVVKNCLLSASKSKSASKDPLKRWKAVMESWSCEKSIPLLAPAVSEILARVAARSGGTGEGALGSFSVIIGDVASGKALLMHSLAKALERKFKVERVSLPNYFGSSSDTGPAKRIRDAFSQLALSEIRDKTIVFIDGIELLSGDPSSSTQSKLALAELAHQVDTFSRQRLFYCVAVAHGPVDRLLTAPPRFAHSVKCSISGGQQQGAVIFGPPPVLLGMKGIMESLESQVLIPLIHEKQLSVIGLRMPRGVLLYGGSGTGKTTLAREFLPQHPLLRQANCTFFGVHGTQLISKVVGETEANVKSMFTRARANAPCILFIDHIDILAPVRKDVDGNYEDRVLSTLLMELDGVYTASETVVLLATSHAPHLVDPALLRCGRLDIHIQTPPILSVADQVKYFDSLITRLVSHGVTCTFPIHSLARPRSGAALHATTVRLAQCAMSHSILTEDELQYILEG